MGDVDICTFMVLGGNYPSLSDTATLVTRHSELGRDPFPPFLLPVGLVCCSWSTVPEPVLHGVSRLHSCLDC